MKKNLILFSLSLFISCTPASNIYSQSFDLIPSPVSQKESNNIGVKVLQLDADAEKTLSPYLGWVKTWPIEIKLNSANPNIKFLINKEIASEGYDLKIASNQVILSYSDKGGLRNSLSSLLQLQLINEGQLPEIEIQDKPAFSYRGMHLDVGRHIFSVADIKKYIDYLSLYKFNKFHWHLTEDQGWRIEIKKYPKLQTVAAYREETLIGHYTNTPHQFDGKKYGGYYAQEEIKDIINYAGARGIEVIPEIDLPGHSSALLSAYPELGCEDKVYKAATKWGVFKDVLCPKEETFAFLENVFDEIIELFPSNYIHIGGDECPKDQWKENALCQSIIERENLKDEFELQSYFIKRLEKYINSKGKQIIGWDEIIEGGLAENATVMSWRGIQGGIETAHKHNDVVMTPTSHCYFDYYQSLNEDEPVAIGGFLPYQKVYNWSPVPAELEKEYHKYILGGQGNIWTEYMKTFDKVEYMALTRMITLSEVLWGKNSKSLDAFNDKLFAHTLFWENKGVNIANHLLDITLDYEVIPGKGARVIPISAYLQADIFIKKPLDNSYKLINNDPVFLDGKGIYSFQSKYGDKTGNVTSINFFPHFGNKAEIELKHLPSEKYAGNGPSSLINGIIGPDLRYIDNEWLGFSGDDFEATITFEEEEKVNWLDLRFFKSEEQWIYLPSSIEIFAVEPDGKETLLGERSGMYTESKVSNTEIKFPSTYVKQLRVHVKNFGIIPEGRRGEGNPAWLFVDEIVIR